MKQLTKTLELYLVKKAPALPKNVKEILVKIAPWMTILGIVISIPGIMVLLGLSTMLNMIPYGSYTMTNLGNGFSMSVLFLIVSLVLQILAVPGLMKRKISGWNYLYYAALVSLVYSLLGFKIVSGLIGALVSFYFLFQVKSYYK